jgi:hypothetical protein
MTLRIAKPRIQWLLITSILVLVVDPSAAAARETPKKPRLVVTSVKAAAGEQTPLHRFLQGPGVDLVVKIKNKGTAGTRRGDHSGVLLSKAAGALSFSHETTFEFPRLGPGETAEAEVSASGRPFNTPDRIDTAIPKACVPVNGSAVFDGSGTLTGRKSCAEGPQFAVIPRAWDGTMSSTQPVYGYGKLESVASPTFRYSAGVSKNVGEFVYGGTGDLIHTVSGSNGTCSIRGGKNSKIGPGEAGLVLEPSLLQYRGFMNTTDVFEAKMNCNGRTFPAQMRTTGIPIASTHRDDESETKLKGNGSAGNATYRWELDAQ